MQDQINQLMSQLQDIQSQLDALSSSPDISRDTQTALNTRFAGDPAFATSILNPVMMWGKAALTSGTATIKDPRIKSTSTVAICNDTTSTSDLVFAFPVANGSVVLGSNGSNNFGVYYIIIF